MVETQATSDATEPPATAPIQAGLAVAFAGQTTPELIGPLLRSAERELARGFPDRSGVFLLTEQDSADGTMAAARDAVTDPARLIQLAAPHDGPRAPSPAARAQTIRLIFESAAAFGADALAVIDADLTTLEPDGIHRLLRPVVEQGADFVGPYYARPRFAGAITSSIVYPFMRALYGRRLRFPAGGDFACSSRFGKFCSAQATWGGDGSRIATDLWLVHRALTGGFKMSQAVIGLRSGAAADEDAELSAVLARVLGALFIETERNVPFWQKVRTSEPVPLAGTPVGAEKDGPTIDFKQTVDAFRLGLDHLMPVWEVVLPPSSLHELRKLARRTEDQFRLPDALWARIVYDFAIAFHTRVMSREHLLPAFAPLYLGWLASHVAEMSGADFARSERRVEDLCLRFEAEKPYLISRWRWPDRFNP